MKKRLCEAKPKRVNAATVREWSIFTDASFEADTCGGGLGGILVNDVGECCGWFSIIKLETDVCRLLGADLKETIIYELELLAACVALHAWADKLESYFLTLYGDNDSVRFALIRGTGLGLVAGVLMQHHLETEVFFNSNVWFPRVPTEANIGDIPSRFQEHPVLGVRLDDSSKAYTVLLQIFWKESKRSATRCQTWGSKFTLLHPALKDCVSSCFQFRLHQREHDHAHHFFCTFFSPFYQIEIVLNAKCCRVQAVVSKGRMVVKLEGNP